ncbi:RING finger protein 44-like isoform X1 [Ananas comosus]|uniref:RING-type E3 ubiquitin transferase n=1 Tax=Ananas comosus TaxID=4615 RepID=A0A199W8B4_ANACO|nr:RING finger protein 44-like isoform X1 [Ananas comosus]XP_020083517.1 RING finger protein 44-like isoform X1 [Ananas comosus]XP_020083523.1 RING finger protein 44-like isoform X1 [Ananas comosus]OAY85135.1 E3 ubiquitin-protein ligase MBR2 [Ananas comosus]
MAYRNIICTHQISGLEPEEGHTQGNPIDFPNRSAPLSISASNASNIEIQHYRSYHNRTMYPGNQYNYIPNCHPIPNLDVGSSLTSNFYNPHIGPSSSSRVFAIPSPIEHQAIVAANMDGFGRNGNLVESARESSKRKIMESFPGNYCAFNGFPSSSSSSYESDVPSPNAATFTPLEYRGGENIQPPEEYSRTVRDLPIVHHNNYLSPANYGGQSFQPSTNTWVAQNGNTMSHGGMHWNYVNGTSDVHGSLHHGSIPYFHQNQPPLQSMQPHGLVHHTDMPANYQHPFHNLLIGGLNPSNSGPHLGHRFPPFPSNAEHIYRNPWHLIQGNAEFNRGSVRMVPSEHAAFAEFSGVDEHRDMRLDIDSMTYEELLALEEQIGDVNTGLTEEFILKNLRTSKYIPWLKPSLSDKESKSDRENEACVICQVEYKERETIATLNCGHKYHRTCIKQWLLLKNLCPICKVSALSIDSREGRGCLE